jgi:ribonucleoside-diphosphate reductase alpha chain/ribonucleoside-triphosphate reductase
MRVPDWILQATNNVKLAYLAGVLAGGTPIAPASTLTNGPVTLVTTMHEGFARDIQTVLYSCGLASRLCTNIGGHPVHGVHLISHRTIKSLTDKFSPETIENDQETPLEVISVEPAGKGYTYDITVDGPNEQEGTHEFFVNGLLSHNTAEMFIFEEDDYEVLFAKYGLNGFYKPEELEHHIQLGEDLVKMGIKPVWFDQLTTMFQKQGYANRTGLNHRHLSNNSILFQKRPSFEYLQLLLKILRYEGEPGLINAEEMMRRRPNAELVNPCGEIILDSCQTCNLTTVNLTQFVGTDPQGRPYLKESELIEAQKLSVRAGLRMTLVSLELPHWDEKQKRDRLIGTSLTGIKDTFDQLNYTKADEIYIIQKLGDAARQEALRYAKEIRIAAPLLVTTIKPEGSLSQLAGGISQGLHLSHSPFFIRRIRISSRDPMVSVIKNAGWSINPENGTPGATYDEKMANARTYVIDFPVHTAAKKTKYQTTVEEQLDTYFTYQKIYADHNCSNTISVKNDEWDRLPQIIHTNWDKYLGITFIPLDGGNYELAPYEECSEAKYHQLKDSMGAFDLALLETFDRQLYSTNDSTEESHALPADDTLKSDCAGGICPIK